MSPLSEEAKKLFENSSAMLFSAGAIHTVEENRFRKLGELLGVYWTRETVESMFNPTGEKSNQPRKDLLIPMLLGQQPSLQEFIRNSFGSSLGISPPEWYRSVERGEVVEGYAMPRQDFAALAGMFTGLIPTDYLRKTHG